MILSLYYYVLSTIQLKQGYDVMQIRTVTFTIYYIPISLVDP